MKWARTKQELLVFSENIHNEHKTIKFEHNDSHSNVPFLDKLIYKDMSNTLQTTIYQKSTEQQSYLHACSEI